MHLADIKYWIDVENLCTYQHFIGVSSENFLQQIVTLYNTVYAQMNNNIDVNLRLSYTECFRLFAIFYV